MCGSPRLRQWSWFAILACAAGSVALAQGHERKRAERAEITRLEQQWRQAELSEDVPEAEHMLSEDFLGITAAGQVVTKVQELDRMRMHQLDLTRLDISDTKVKISGHIAVVTSLAHLEGKADGQPLSGNFRYTRVYRRVPGDGWKITNFEATRVHNGLEAYGAESSSPQANAAAPPAAAPSSGPASPAGPGSPQPPS